MNALDSSKFRHLKIRGRQVPYLDRVRIRRRDYYLLERVGSPTRHRFKAFDPLAGPGGDYFQVQRWAAGARADHNLRLLKRMKQDSFPRVAEWELQESSYWVALTWVEGVSLTKYVDNLRKSRRPPLDPGEAVRLIRGLANAVCTLHVHTRICHGDIQSANVVLTQHPSRLALIDFGSAWNCESARTRLRGDGAHPCYAAPEVVKGSDTSGFHADQFSVSVLLYELLTHALPYQGLGGKAGWPEFSDAASSLAPPSQISDNCRRLPRSTRQHLDRFVLRGLALSPDDRFPNRHAWLDELFQLHARMRIVPQLTSLESWLTRLIECFVTPNRANSR